MKFLESFARFWYDFIVGDDWTIALGVVVAVALTALAARAGLAAWAILPVTVTAGLTWSVARARRRSGPVEAAERPDG
jgi:UDP-N-acetylmuramyl pentapeptide phosphotransferase/UDP-N-acetylglucosamine-1-phosphate transferase